MNNPNPPTNKRPEFKTAICEEVALDNNPFVAQTRFIKGYACDELWQQASGLDVILLHFLDDLPSPAHSALFNTLMIGLMNMGPREADNRAAMTAGISKTRPEHLLPLGLLSGQGHASGATAVLNAHSFIQTHRKTPAQEVLANLATEASNTSVTIPGFGTLYGSIDPSLQRLSKAVAMHTPQSDVFAWCFDLANGLNDYRQGWLAPGLMAASAIEMGIGPREAMGLYQLIKSVSILVYGLEQSHAPLQHAPLLDDEFYEFPSPL